MNYIAKRNLKSFIVDFVPMNDECGERISIKDVLRNKKKVIDYYKEIEDSFFLYHACKFLEDKGYKIVGTTDLGKNWAVVCEFDYGNFSIFDK